MASALAKLIASKLLSVRLVSSSSRFYNTKSFQPPLTPCHENVSYDKEFSPNEGSDVKESVSNKDTVRKRDLGPIIDLMSGLKSLPCEYYYHVIDDAEEIDSFTASLLVARGVCVNANVHVCSVLQDPKAVYIIVGVEAPDTGDLYGGYIIANRVDNDGFREKNTQ
ncbi:hypothetical protein Tco_0808171 [Tanacetum coccineum]